MDSKLQRLCYLVEFKPRFWYKEYQRLMLELYDIPPLINGAECKGYNPENRKGTKVAQLDPTKWEMYYGYEIEPIRYLREDELDD